MYKNQLQELAQRSCFNLPSYACKREGPDHAPRFKASVNFNGEIFESPGYSPTLRQAEHAAAEVALDVLSSRGSKALTARVLDETGVYKNLLQETAHKAGLNLPAYTTIRTGPGHVPVFTCTAELAGMSFTGNCAKTKKQAEKNAAIAAWSSLKNMPRLVSTNQESTEDHKCDVGEHEEVIVTRVLSSFRPEKSARQKDHHHHHRNRYRNHNHDHNHSRRSRNARSWRSDDSNKCCTNTPWKSALYLPTITTGSYIAADQQQQKKSSFVDLLPPPPPRTISKILPLTSNNGKLLDDIMKRPAQAQAQARAQTQTQTHFRNLFMGSGSSSLSCAQMGMMGNYNSELRGIAPAVQIRSVIPVCAAPPPSSSSLLSSSSSIKLTSKKEEPSAAAAAAAGTSELVSEVTKPVVCSTNLSSDLTKLQLKED